MTGSARGSTLSRLLHMPPREILFRLRQGALVEQERFMVRVGLDPAGRPRLRAAEADSRFFFDPKDRSNIVADLRDHHRDWIQQAEDRAYAICADPAYREPRWSVDPGTGTAWPPCFYADVDIFAGDRGQGDVRILWELNRHRALVDLAKASFVTGRKDYADRCWGLLLDWQRQNPYGVGVNWASALEVSMRVLSWIWIYFFLGGREGLPEATRRALLTGLHEHGVYLERHLSTYFSPNNHLVGEAAALSFLGVFSAALPRAARWQELGWSILAGQVDVQFHADGGNSEQATCYHHFTLGLYLQAAILRHMRGEAVEPAVWERLERATWFTLHLTRPDGRVPMIGDNDDAIACPVGEGPGWDFRHYLAVGAAQFRRPEFARGAGRYSELAYWLLGSSGRNAFESLTPRSPEVGSVALPESGYCVLRSGWEADSHHLVLDCGPLAAGVLPLGPSASAHGHADALALEVAAHGRPMVVDPGCPSYNGDQNWLLHFRGTRAHNTIVVDGRSQSEPAGRLRWKSAAQTRLDCWISSEDLDYARGSHDGYDRLQAGLRHHRAVLFLRPWGWVVWDRLEGAGAHDLETCLHFDPNVAVEPTRSGILARHGEVSLEIRLLGEHAVLPRLARGGDAPHQGWIATSYVSREAAWTAHFQTRLALPATLWQVHRPRRGTIEPLEVHRLPGRGAEGLLIEEGPSTHLLLHSERPGLQAALGGLETDARLLWLTRGDREAVTVRVLEGSFVRLGGNEVWRGRDGKSQARFETAQLGDFLGAVGREP